jgi:hypothetical protein
VTITAPAPPLAAARTLPVRLTVGQLNRLLTEANLPPYSDNRGHSNGDCPVDVAPLPRSLERRHPDAVARWGATCLRVDTAGYRVEAAPTAGVMPAAVVAELTALLGIDVVRQVLALAVTEHDPVSHCTDLYLVGVTLEGA